MRQIAIILFTFSVFLSVQAQKKNNSQPELNNTFKVHEEVDDSELNIHSEIQMHKLADGGGSGYPTKLIEAISLNNRGVESFLEKKYDKALAYFHLAALKSPESIPIQTNLANALLSKNYYSEAVEICRKMISNNDAKSGSVYAILGNALYEMGNFTESATFFQKAVDFEKQNANYYNNLGIALYSAEDKQAALGAFENAVKNKLIFPEALNNYGVTLVELGKYKEAAQKFQQAIKQKPGFANAHGNLGMVFSHLNKKKEARKSFLEAVRLKPEWSIVHYNLGVSYLAEGNREEARRCLKILEKIDENLAGQFQKEFYRDYIIDVSEAGNN
jgi:tetratricopeptide (TPR) repeat protein